MDEEDPNDVHLLLLQKNKANKEVAKYYNHAKHKVLFIIYTVRNTRKMIKVLANDSIVDTLSFISILLQQKATMLNRINLNSIHDNSNIYNLPNFLDFMTCDL